MNYKAKTFYKGKIAQQYDKERFSSFKGKLYNWFEKRSITRALRIFHKFTIVTILDLPCGTGRITEHIYKLGYKVQGTDVSEDMLKIAKSRLPNIYFWKADIETMANHSNLCKGYSVIVCMRFMGHLPFTKKIKALKTMKYMAYYLIVTFYKNKWYKKCPPNWYPIEDRDLEHLLEICGLRILFKFPICPGWSDGITYILE